MTVAHLQSRMAVGCGKLSMKPKMRDVGFMVYSARRSGIALSCFGLLGLGACLPAHASHPTPDRDESKAPSLCVRSSISPSHQPLPVSENTVWQEVAGCQACSIPLNTYYDSHSESLSPTSSGTRYYRHSVSALRSMPYGEFGHWRRLFGTHADFRSPALERVPILSVLSLSLLAPESRGAEIAGRGRRRRAPG
ncbi:hypothetical protein DFP72DRAFT_875750 [Ephemerocybe angulata]|uniref:Uncharacterized protein n=1 Tax=Ephemerocybe angulata TaxID=980116 RepID=A0A8H6IFY5_9AGAR|nr:hypothetical protein DFP72DRAFT_875750 [Tulosesus angulatus]